MPESAIVSMVADASLDNETHSCRSARVSSLVVASYRLRIAPSVASALPTRVERDGAKSDNSI